jgi:hypothetical protein
VAVLARDPERSGVDRVGVRDRLHRRVAAIGRLAGDEEQRAAEEEEGGGGPCREAPRPDPSSHAAAARSEVLRMTAKVTVLPAVILSGAKVTFFPAVILSGAKDPGGGFSLHDGLSHPFRE